MPIFFPEVLTFFPSRLRRWRKNTPVPAGEIPTNTFDCSICDLLTGLVKSPQAALETTLGFKNASRQDVDYGPGLIHGRWKACSAGWMP
jgi:hypothetical protein